MSLLGTSEPGTPPRPGRRRLGLRRAPAVPGAGRGGLRGRRDDPQPRAVRRRGPRRSAATCTTRPRCRRPSRAATRRTTSCTPWTPRTSSGSTRRRRRRSGRPRPTPGVQRIVYLGGLGKDDDELSPHLRSRREVEQLLGAAGVPVTTLRAGIVIGHQGLSWEMTRQLVERLPLMVTPRWVSTRTQPIALERRGALPRRRPRRPGDDRAGRSRSAATRCSATPT